MFINILFVSNVVLMNVHKTIIIIYWSEIFVKLSSPLSLLIYMYIMGHKMDFVKLWYSFENKSVVKMVSSFCSLVFISCVPVAVLTVCCLLQYVVVVVTFCSLLWIIVIISVCCLLLKCCCCWWCCCLLLLYLPT